MAAPEEEQQQQQQQPASTADALSYIDKDYDDPRMKEIVHSLIEEEMAAFEPPDYLADKPLPATRFKSPLLKSEWARVRAEKPLDVMDTSRYDLQPPQGAAAEDEAAWKRALDNARAQTEHQHNSRLLNLELLQNYGASMWLGHNKAEEGTEAAVASQAKRAREEAERVNLKRKTSQEAAERTLWNLARKRSEGFDKNVQIQLACEGLRAEVKRLKALEAAVKPPPAR
ncbi:unnamed protein product [Ectocarpus sp. 12 AP-2014]